MVSSKCAKKRRSRSAKRCPAGSRRDTRVGCDRYKTVRCRPTAVKAKKTKAKSPAPRRKPSSSLKRVVTCKAQLKRLGKDYDIVRCAKVIECKDGEKKKKLLIALFDRTRELEEYDIE